MERAPQSCVGAFFFGGIVIIREPSEFGSKHNVPRTIVVHAMGEFILDPHPIHASDFLVKLGLSAHALVAPNGTIYVTRDDDQGAYHARGYNTNSLGIEFLVEGHHNYSSFIEAIKSPYLTPEQYDAGRDAIQSWISAYDIKQVVRHSDISPGRKVDPGAGFPWKDLMIDMGCDDSGVSWN
jgi:N-acetyl-anhydromuramyl-L-alanine amidase AmpD